ncbi:MAG: bifunctional 3-deoxy-7-phosphoheptulonate synthase/chorismate mutase type II [Bacteroidales bacterium]|nr:bifunctional 3-deoxy-7-phosphoheptulonate synthase/chorismate mutase type II [Bacteroidales bacterium]MBQ2076878.1 bifunctional 3-deoxy-7-phosphoheptulonate synthase/chorismate mutase type II [Bacteroidales bacterium]MBQ2351431.1 bifunctional 3-deoxy-7-phosphoheptulonate synthase/chorismate mutase type II [Bacteroidales bacterium]MBQ5424511.1 bifunctional 3-deoxy-7-phosphoheptulonate synthase/chorismate mutase type II [Bacteroidales bacterium]MBQ5458472.1 bifunctional 3-deoxy-7-phosphoheptul
MAKQLMLICGPCSAESEEQVLETARQLKELVAPDYFRAGIWKPRTRPNSFEGVGEKGLAWMQRVQDELNIPVITEVANASHIEKITKYGFSAFWIGARTVANPFSVQEIAEAAKGGKFKVFVKNPTNPDIDLWCGAIERFKKLGFNEIIAISRGFYPFAETKLRNLPCWEIPIELARRMPDIKIICDPSHIAGDTKYIAEIAQQAMDLNMAGLMIESHCCPHNALSDKQQQLDPTNVKQLLNSLKIKSSYVNDHNFEIELEMLRNKIDVLDYQLLDILKQRFAITNEIGEIKKVHNVAVLQIERWKKVLESRSEYGERLGLSRELVAALFSDIHKESIKEQSDDLNIR